MPQDPITIETARLFLRPVTLDDIPAVVALAGRREIADTMISIPHPLTAELAREWIARRETEATEGRGFCFAIGAKPEGGLVGAIELRAIDREHLHAELSCWIGAEWWGRGFASEAVGAVVRHAFDGLALNRLYAYHMARNPASGRVLAHWGFRQEALLRQCVCKWGVFEDVVLVALLRDDWMQQPKRA